MQNLFKTFLLAELFGGLGITFHTIIQYSKHEISHWRISRVIVCEWIVVQPLDHHPADEMARLTGQRQPAAAGETDQRYKFCHRKHQRERPLVF